jgi:hypothetical protein
MATLPANNYVVLAVAVYASKTFQYIVFHVERGITHGVTIEEEPKTSNQHDNPLKLLSVDSLIDLSHANKSILQKSC